MTDAELERRFHGACPWCNTHDDPGPCDGYDGGGSHSLGLALIEEVQRLRTLTASLVAQPEVTVSHIPNGLGWS